MHASTVAKAVEQNKQRTQKQQSQIAPGPTDQAETPSGARTRSSQSSDGPDGSAGSVSSPVSASPAQSSDSTARELEPGEMFSRSHWFPLSLTSLQLFFFLSLSLA